MAGQAQLTLAVAAGSALGSVARYLVSIGLPGLAGFPWDTLVVNVLGAFAIGLYATLAAPAGRWPAGPVRYQLVVTGVCGGFTTFSIFSFESIGLAQQGAYGLAAFSVALSAALWLVAVWAGFAVASRLNRAGQAARP